MMDKFQYQYRSDQVGAVELGYRPENIQVGGGRLDLSCVGPILTAEEAKERRKIAQSENLTDLYRPLTRPHYLRCHQICTSARNT